MDQRLPDLDQHQRYPSYPFPNPRLLSQDFTSVAQDASFGSQHVYQVPAYQPPQSKDSLQLPPLTQRFSSAHNTDDELPAQILPIPQTDTFAQGKGSGRKRLLGTSTTDPPPSKPKRTKPPVKKDAMGSEPKGAGRRRQPGSTAYSVEECEKFLDCIEEHLPIGGAGWSAVAKQYNAWASQMGYTERTDKGLRVKFDVLHGTLKPTGTGEMEPVIRRAKEIEERIVEKSSRMVVDDNFGPDDPDNYEAHEQPLTDWSLSGGEEEAAKVSKKATTVVKAYRSEPPLAQTKRLRNSAAAAATEALATVSSLFHPSKIREREEKQVATSLQIAQISTLQAELREARHRIDTLQDRLYAESRRADQLESELRMERILHQRRRHADSDEESYYSHSNPRSHSSSYRPSRKSSRSSQHHSRDVHTLHSRSPSPSSNHSFSTHNDDWHDNTNPGYHATQVSNDSVQREGELDMLASVVSTTRRM